MDEFFMESQHPTSTQDQSARMELQYQPFQFGEADNNPQVQPAQPAFQFNSLSPPQPANNGEDDGQYEFNQFEEDQASRRIREEEDRIQNMLRERSDREWSQKTKRKDQGRRQLNEFLAAKQEQKTERATRNIRNEAENKEEMSKLNIDAGWKKVISNINVRQGQRKGTKDANRMRQAILHRRQDDSR